MAKLSVIVPVYNASRFLDRCIGSITSQTYKDLEIILVDDGSTDNSLYICNQYAHADSRIKVIHKSNGGQSTARNVGLDSATGNYITFVDSDDYIDCRMYELMVSAMRVMPNELVICNSNTIQEGKIVEPTRKAPHIQVLSVNQIWQEVFGNLNNAVWNKIYLRNVIGNQRFPVDIAHGEDLIFNLQYLQKCKGAIYIDAKLYNYIQRKDSVTGSSFTPKNIYEIVSKDIAYSIVKVSHPQMLSVATKYCFRARLNVLRSIYRSNLEKENKAIIEQIKGFIKQNCKKDWQYLTKKEKIEYLLFFHFHPIYKVLIRIYKLWLI